MSDNIVARYEKLLGQEIPLDLKNLITKRDSAVAYIRRGFDNVVFQQDLQLDPPKDDKKKSRRRRMTRKGA